jgi:putative acetyltransferase
MQSSIITRPYTIADIDTIMEIFLSAVHVIASKDYSPAQIAAWGQVDRERWIKRCDNRPVWIAEIKGIAAGFADLESNGHLDMLFVHAGYQHQGVASALLRHIEEHAIAIGISRIFTEASITARPFFEKKGFKLITAQIVEIRGQQLKNFRMEKIL